MNRANGRFRRPAWAAAWSGVASAGLAAVAMAGDGTAGQPFGPPAVCGGCCGVIPPISGFANTPVVLGTDMGNLSTEYVVHIFDVSGFNSQAPGYWAPPRYEFGKWTRNDLGTVFGITVDGSGNIYVSYFSMYPIAGSYGSYGGDSGAVHILDGTTGVPSLLVNLPNDPLTGPGLGNLTWSCEYSSLYVSNFEDGRIYRIDPSAPAGSRVKSAWDFATDSIALNGTPESTDQPGLAPLGERVWGIAVAGDRMYFSVWGEDSCASQTSNTIWSVQLDANGDAIPATKTLEITVTPAPGVQRNPVSDLAFNNECCLYAAQRSMCGAGTGAHVSDLLKYCWTPPIPGQLGGWTQSGTFEIGEVNIGGYHSSAGGVGVDNGTNGFVWATGDYIKAVPWSYGIVGMNQAGGNYTNYLAIDMDGDATQNPDYDKNRQGSCEVICSLGPTCDVTVEDVDCILGADGLPTGEYSVVVTITNHSGQTVNMLLFPTLGSFQYLKPAAPDGESATLKVVCPRQQHQHLLHRPLRRRPPTAGGVMSRSTCRSASA